MKINRRTEAQTLHRHCANRGPEADIPGRTHCRGRCLQQEEALGAAEEEEARQGW